MDTAAKGNRRFRRWFLCLLLLMLACPALGGTAMVASGGRIHWSYNSLYGLWADYETGPGYGCDNHETILNISFANKGLIRVDQHTLCIDRFVRPFPHQTPVPKPKPMPTSTLIHSAHK
jgi:hypothetical protein